MRRVRRWPGLLFNAAVADSADALGAAVVRWLQIESVTATGTDERLVSVPVSAGMTRASHSARCGRYRSKRRSPQVAGGIVAIRRCCAPIPVTGFVVPAAG